MGIPTKIDRSVLASYSGAIQSHLFGTLKYLHLISQHGIPTDRLTKLVPQKEPQGKQYSRIFLLHLINSYLKMELIFRESLQMSYRNFLIKKGCLEGRFRKL